MKTDRRLVAFVRNVGIAFAAALVLCSCGSVPTAGTAAQADVWKRYELALADAALARPEYARALAPIPDRPVVQVVSWVVGDRRPCEAVGCRFTVGERRMWVTLAGEVQETCRRWGLQGDELRVRLEQLLGLPPDTPAQWRKTHVLTLDVPRAAIERPCLGEATDERGATRCTLRTAKTGDSELRQFVLAQMADVWVHGDPQSPGYPFTRLGYTYDWNPQAASSGHYGASEFVLRPGTPATVTAEATTDAYCRP